MNLVDSSGWLEYFADGPNADFFAQAIEKPDELVVPTINLYEVFKRILQQRSESEALQAIASMQQGDVVDLNATLALSAANIAHAFKIPMADSIVFAIARAYQAVLWTQHEHFKDLEGVRYVGK